MTRAWQGLVTLSNLEWYKDVCVFYMLIAPSYLWSLLRQSSGPRDQSGLRGAVTDATGRCANIKYVFYRSLTRSEKIPAMLMILCRGENKLKFPNWWATFVNVAPSVRRTAECLLILFLSILYSFIFNRGSSRGSGFSLVHLNPRSDHFTWVRKKNGKRIDALWKLLWGRQAEHRLDPTARRCPLLIPSDKGLTDHATPLQDPLRVFPLSANSALAGHRWSANQPWLMAIRSVDPCPDVV